MPHCKKLIRTLKSALPRSDNEKSMKMAFVGRKAQRRREKESARRTEGKGAAQNELNIRPKLTRQALSLALNLYYCEDCESVQSL